MVLKAGRLCARLPVFRELLRAAGRGLALSAAAAHAGGGEARAAAAAGRTGRTPQSPVSFGEPAACACAATRSLYNTPQWNAAGKKHRCRSCPRRAGAQSLFISAVCAQASRKFSSTSSVTEHLLKACTAKVISPSLAVMLLNVCSLSFKRRLFQLNEVVLAQPAAFCSEDLWAGLTLAMVIEYKASHRKLVIFQKHCYENKEVEL